MSWLLLIIQVDHGFPSWKEAVNLNASFLLSQIKVRDEISDCGNKLREARFITELEAEVMKMSAFLL